MLKFQAKTIYEALGREPVHPFPARMAPGIALELLSNTDKRLRVLDPMMGSGTVLAMARSKGHQAIGVDIDPLAVLISKVWTTSIDPDEVQVKAKQVLARAKVVFHTLHQKDAYPRYADHETRRFVVYWFDGYARRQLAALSIAIGRVRDEVARNVLWCAFSRLIIAKRVGASLAMDLAHSRPHKSFDRAPAKPFQKFLESVERVTRNCIEKSGIKLGPATGTHLGDARDLPLRRESVDLVLTSPPYLNAIDYVRCSKFSLVWMGHSIADLRILRRESIGAETGKNCSSHDQDVINIVNDLHLKPRLIPRDEKILVQYITDMRSALKEVARVLSPGGKAIYVIGENTIRGTYIRNTVIMTALAQLSGLRLKERFSRVLPANRRYLPPPSALDKSSALSLRIRREAVLIFSKPAAA